ncbi:ribosomal subunit interface protein [Candidatus Saccharibacteria bacterium 49-20]|nr:MAG: ribosomal subunit interface protein [Candidatus Saccharibacteria bacterium 49-20]
MIASIDITGIQYNVSEKMQKYVTDRVGKLDRYVPAHARKSLVADVKLRQVNRDHGNKYEAEIILKVPEKTIIAKDTTMNMHAAVDIVEAKLIAQLRKYKDSITARKLAAQ